MHRSRLRRRHGHERVEPAVRTHLPAIQRIRDGRTNAFRRCVSLAVSDMGIAQRHAWMLVAEQAGDDGQGDALQDGMTGERVP